MLFDNIIDRMDIDIESNCFMKIKVHKVNFLNDPKVHLVNPAENELGRISKTKLFETTKNSQLKNMVNAIKWFTSVKYKLLIKFVRFDIKDFCPSIIQDLLKKALNFPNKYINIMK